MYRFQTRDNMVPQIGRFIRRIDNAYIFNANGIETSYHTNTLLGICSHAQMALGLMICLFVTMVQLEEKCMANPGTGTGTGTREGSSANPAKILKNK